MKILKRKRNIAKMGTKHDHPLPQTLCRNNTGSATSKPRYDDPKVRHVGGGGRG